MSGAQCNVSIGRRNGRGRIHVYIVSGTQCSAAIGRRNGILHVDIASGTRLEISLSGSNWLVHVQVPNGVQCQSRWSSGRRPADRLVNVNIAVAFNGTIVTGNSDIRCNQLSAEGGAGDVTARANSKVLRIDQPGAVVASGGSSGNDGVVGDLDMRRRGFNEAAIPTIRCRGIQCAANVDSAALHVTQQPDCAVVVLDGLRLDQAGIVHHTG